MLTHPCSTSTMTPPWWRSWTPLPPSAIVSRYGSSWGTTGLSRPDRCTRSHPAINNEAKPRWLPPQFLPASHIYGWLAIQDIIPQIKQIAASADHPWHCLVLTSRCLSPWLASSLGRGSGLQEHCWGEGRGEGHCPSSYKAGRCTPCAGCFQDDFLSRVSGAIAEWRNYRLGNSWGASCGHMQMRGARNECTV